MMQAIPYKKYESGYIASATKSIVHCDGTVTWSFSRLESNIAVDEYRKVCIYMFRHWATVKEIDPTEYGKLNDYFSMLDDVIAIESIAKIICLIGSYYKNYD
jgi:hypothetical protein